MRIRTLAISLTAAGALLAPAGIANAATCGVPDAPGGEWPFYGGTHNSNRHQLEENTISTSNVLDLGVAWMASPSDGGTIHSTPVLVDGCVFTGTNLGNAYSLNADTGEIVWERSVGPSNGGNQFEGAGIVGSPAVDNGLVFVASTVTSGESKGGLLSALNQASGEIVWQTLLDNDDGSGLDSSPVPFNGMIFQAFKGDESSDHSKPGFAFVDQQTGAILKKSFIVPEDDYAAGYRGGSIINTPSVDLENQLVFAATGNPASERQHPRTNALLKIDADPLSSTFGEIVATHRGTSDSYPAPQDVDSPTCQSDIQWPVGRISCAQLDFNFLSSPALWEDSEGRAVFGGLQKSGVFTAVYADTFERAFQVPLGPPCLACNLSSIAVDESGVYVAVSGGNLYSLNKDTGLPQWATAATGTFRYNGLAVANGVLYSLNDAGATLEAFDTSTGVPLFAHPFGEDTGELMHDMGNSSGVSVARGTVFATSQNTDNNSTLFALKPGAGGGGTEPPDPGELPDAGDLPAPGGAIASGPGAASYGYLTPAMVTTVGGPLNYTNGDIAQHDVVSRETRNGQPLFKTPLIGLGETAEVTGLENVESGKTYEFYCSLHSGMKGSLVVQ